LQVVGASGYTGLELIKILIEHPIFKIEYLATREGEEKVTTLHPSLKNIFESSVEKIDVDKFLKMLS